MMYSALFAQRKKLSEMLSFLVLHGVKQSQIVTRETNTKIQSGVQGPKTSILGLEAQVLLSYKLGRSIEAKSSLCTPKLN